METEENDDGVIHSYTYIAKDGSIKLVKVDPPVSPAASIAELAKDYSADMMIVKNIRTGYRFKITMSVDDMLVKYSRIYGYIWNTRSNGWSNRSNVVYGPWKPEWVVLWFKTKDQAQQYRSRF